VASLSRSMVRSMESTDVHEICDDVYEGHDCTSFGIRLQNLLRSILSPLSFVSSSGHDTEHNCADTTHAGVAGSPICTRRRCFFAASLPDLSASSAFKMASTCVTNAYQHAAHS